MSLRPRRRLLLQRLREAEEVPAPRHAVMAEAGGPRLPPRLPPRLQVAELAEVLVGPRLHPPMVELVGRGRHPLTVEPVGPLPALELAEAAVEPVGALLRQPHRRRRPHRLWTFD